jgi:hypothetical protein
MASDLRGTKVHHAITDLLDLKKLVREDFTVERRTHVIVAQHYPFVSCR